MPNDQPTGFPVDTSQSPHARLKPVPLNAVTLTDDFWALRARINREVTLPAQYAQLEATGRLNNFRRAAGHYHGPFAGYVYNDSDVYKWLEGALWALATGDNPALAAQVATVISLIEAAQQPDGYLNTYYTFERASQRWTNLRDMHELYCAGHLIQAAIAHQRTTGSERLLAVARRFADHICQTFTPAHPGAPGHPEIEMALVELTRLTGDKRYQSQARFFLNQRGRGLIGGQAYHGDHLPFYELPQLAGHAVRALYLCAGAADLYAETGEPALLATLERLWQRMVAAQLYVTGGAGARHEGEAFGEAYELPNARAYAETCAGIAIVFWGWRMLALAGEAPYTDLLEWALYNAALPGISLDGQHYFYENPLQNDGSHRRQPWFTCACCPTNIVRLIALLPSYLYTTSAEGVWAHLYAASEARLTLPDGRAVALTQKTRYPWDGDITLTLDGAGEFSLFLRVPGWCENGAALTVNGRAWDAPLAPGSYVEVRRVWESGDTVQLQLPMPVRPVEAHPYALENAGRVALTRGPLVYCLEEVDHPGVDLRDVRLSETLEAVDRPELLAGVVTLEGNATIHPLAPEWNGALYRAARPAAPVPAQTLSLRAIPYYAWANREPGQLQVWLKEKTY